MISVNHRLTRSLQRLSNQMVSRSSFSDPVDLLSYMGAIQAQDMRMAYLAIASRVQESTISDIENAINEGKLIRTHLLRPTWHIVAAQDFHWVLHLTAPRVRAATRSRHKQLEITGEVVKKSNALIEKEIAKQGHLLREEFFKAFEQAGIAIQDNRGYHLLLRAELDGLICSGELREGKHSYALVEERIRSSTPISEEKERRNWH